MANILSPLFRIKPLVISAEIFRQESHFSYEIPEVYKNCFFLANSSFLNNVNWFVQRAYEVVFNDLVEELKSREPSLHNPRAIERVLNIIKIFEPCSAVVDINYPVKRENGYYSVIQAFRVQHGRCRNDVPCLGGSYVYVFCYFSFL